MNIGIFANYLIFEKAGVGKYTRNLLRALLAVDKKNHYFLYFSFLRRHQQRERLITKLLDLSKVRNVTVKIFPLPGRWFEFLTTNSLPLSFLIKDRLDVFFAPYPAGIPKVGFTNQPTKLVATVHDLVFLRFPEHRGKKLSHYYLKRHKIAIKNCQKIIAVSSSTKKDLHDLLDVPIAKIKVIYEAADSRFGPLSQKERKQAEEVISRYFDPKIKYILSVGTLEPRKNLVRLVEAYSLLPHAMQDEYRLVLVGARGWNNGALGRVIDNLNLTNRVIIPGFVKDEDLPYIYNKAALFVYPSLYEGFGLPVLEAMACGVPVIAGCHSSLPEVVGQAGVLADITQAEEISRVMKKVLAKESERQKLIVRGFLQANKFSWKKAAQETLGVFERI